MERLSPSPVTTQPERLGFALLTPVAIAGARPLLLADEPTGNLDVKSGEEIIKLFRKLCSDRKEPISILMVTHDPRLASKADRMLLLKDGLTAASDIRTAWGIGGEENE